MADQDSRRGETDSARTRRQTDYGPHSVAPSSRFRHGLMLTAVAISILYILYRGLFTLNLTTPWAVFASWFLYIAEVYGVIVFCLYMLQVWDPYEPPEQPVLTGVTVDVFVPSYNEDPAMLRATLEACLRMEYPHNTYLCDDGKRPAVAELCKELGVHYIIRPDNRHAKAGNLNHAFEKTSGEFIIIFDADHVPEPNFITRTLGYFRDPKMAWVQTPHAFYNFDSFQARLDHKGRKYWDEGALFYKVIQPGRNRWNAPIFAGSAAIFRREALKQVGYIAVETITEDMHTGLRMHALGWKSLGISDRLVIGQAAPDITTFHVQRLRWGEGNLSIMAYDNPLTTRGLSWSQALCYFASMINWAGGLFKIPIYVTPILMLFTGVPPVNQFSWTLALITLSYMVVTLWALKVSGNGHASIVNSELFCMVSFWTQVRGTFRATFWRKFQQFVVTAKRGRQSKSIWPFLRAQIVLAIVSVMALFWGWGRLAAGISDDFFKPALPTFWVLIHLILIYMGTKRAFWPEDRRFSTRHIVHLPVEYRLLHDDPKPSARHGVTLDLNELGMALVAYEVLPADTRLRVALRGAGEEIVCEAEVRNMQPLSKPGSGTMHGYRYGLVFHNLSPLQTDALNRIGLQYAIPRMYEMYDKGNAETPIRKLFGWRQRGMVQRRNAHRYPYRVPVIIDRPMAAPKTQKAAKLETVNVPAYAGADSGMADLGGEFVDSQRLAVADAGDGDSGHAPAKRGSSGGFRSGGVDTSPRLFDKFYTATEDLSRMAFAALIDEPIAAGTEVSFLMPTPLGEVRGTAKVVTFSRAVYGARAYYRVVFEFLGYEGSGRTTLQSLVNPGENFRYANVLAPDKQPWPVRMAGRVAACAAICVPLIAVQSGLFVVVYREEFFLREVVTLPRDAQPSPDQVARVERIYAASFADKYPSTDRLVLLMSALARINRADEIDEITKLLAPRDRKNVDLQIALAQALDDTQEYALAEVEFQRMLDLSRRGLLPAERQRDLRLAAARSSVHAKRFDKAAEQFRDLIKENPLDSQVRNEFAGVLISARQFQEARSLYTGIERLDSEGALKLIAVYSLEGNYDQAEAECRKVLKEDPGNRKVQQMLADVLSAKKGYGQSQAIYGRLIAENPRDAALRVKIAKNALAVKQFEAALGQLGQLLKDSPEAKAEMLAVKPSDLGRELLEAYMAAAANAAEASIDESVKAVALEVYQKEVTSSTAEAWFLGQTAWVLQRVKQFEPALALIERAAQMDPKNATLKQQHFGVLVELGKIEDALNMLGDDSGPEARQLLIALYLRDGKYVEAERECRKIVEADPSDLKARRLLGDILSWRKEYAQALTVFADLARSLPDDDAIKARQAEITLWSGDYEGAMALFEKAMAKRPDEPSLAQGFVDAAAGFASKNTRTDRNGSVEILRELTPDQAALAKAIADRRLSSKDQKAMRLSAVSLSRLAYVLLLLKDKERASPLLDRALTLNPEKPEEREELAGALAFAGRPADAIPLVAALPVTPERTFKLAELYSAARDFPKAEALMRQVVEKDPNNKKALFFLADVASWKGDYAASLERFNKLLQAYPEDKEIPLRIAEVTLWSGEADRGAYDRALARFQAMLEGLEPAQMTPRLVSGWANSAASARKRSPANEKMALKLYDVLQTRAGAAKEAGTLARLGWVLFQMGEAAKAEALVEKAYALKPTDPQQRRELAGTLASLKRYPEALGLYDGLQLDTSDRRRLVEIASAAKDYEQAARYARQVVEASPDDKLAQRSLADVLSWKQEYDESLALFESLIASQPDDATLMVRLAEVNLWSRRYPEALKRFYDLLSAQVDNRDLYEGFIDAASSTERLSASQVELAGEVADRVLREDFSDPARLSRLAWILLRAVPDNGDSKPAQKLLNRAMELKITDPEVRREVVGVLARAKRYAEALTMYEGVTLTLDDRRMMAVLLSALLRHEEAAEQLRVVYKAKPDDKLVKTQLADTLTWAKQYTEAVELYTELEEADPQNSKLALKLTQCHLWSGNYALAMRRLVNLREAEGRSPEFWNAVIDAAVQVPDGQFTEEVKVLVREVYDRSLPTLKEAEYIGRLGFAIGRAGDTKRSTELFERALKLKPRSKQLRLQMADMLYKAGRYEEAEQYFKELIDNAPGGDDAGRFKDKKGP